MVGAVFGEVQVSLFVAGTVLGEVPVMSASHEKSPTELASGSTQATEAAVLFPSVFGCQFVQLWPVGRCQNETRNVLGLIQNGPCQVDQISSRTNRASSWHKPTRSPVRRPQVGSVRMSERERSQDKVRGL